MSDQPNQADAEALRAGTERFGDPWWRLNHLYAIQDKAGRTIRFRANAAQTRLWETLHSRNIVLKARQLGFSTFIELILLDQCLFNPGLRGGVIAHTLPDAAVLFRDKLLFAYRHLPDDLMAALPVTREEAGELLLENGSGIRVSTSLRSGTIQLLHVSELGKIAARYPDKAGEIVSGAFPALVADGLAFVESTAEGRDGVFFEMWHRAANQLREGRAFGPLDWRPHFFPWWMDPAYVAEPAGLPIPTRIEEYATKLKTDRVTDLSRAQLAWYWLTERDQGSAMKREYPSTPGEAFAAATDGSYYSGALALAREAGRVTTVPVDPALPVHTAWDLGISDCTTIWFFQVHGLQVRVVGYHEGQGEGLLHYAHLLRTRADKGAYRYGTHLAPHDIQVRELGTGKSRIEQAAEYGIRFEVVPGLSVEDGIESVRRLLLNCVFDAAACEAGLKHLDSYRRDWNDTLGTWSSKPRHDAASHGADAFRMLAVGLGLVCGRASRISQRDMATPAASAWA
jgi:hypothetical protein